MPGRSGAIILGMAVLAVPCIALVYRAEAGLVVMACALAAGSFLLRDALDAAPSGVHRWLRLAILVNLALAMACVGLAAWLLLKR